MFKSLNFKEICKIIWENILIIFVCALVGTMLFGGLAKLKQHTEYSADRNIMISHNLQSSKVEYKDSQLKADLNILPTYAELVTDRSVLANAHDNLSKRLQSKYTTSELKHVVKATAKPNSLILNIQVTAGKKSEAKKVANAVTDSFAQQLPKMKKDVGTIKKLSSVTSNDVSSSTGPSIKKYAVLGFALGVLGGMIIAFSITTWRKLL